MNKPKEAFELNDAVCCHVRMTILNNEMLKEDLSAAKTTLPLIMGQAFDSVKRFVQASEGPFSYLVSKHSILSIFF